MSAGATDVDHDTPETGETGAERTPFVEPPPARRGPVRWPYAVAALALIVGGLWPVLHAVPEAFRSDGETPAHMSVLYRWPAVETYNEPRGGFLPPAIHAYPVAAGVAVLLTLVFARGLTRALLMHAYAALAWCTVYALPVAGGALTTGMGALHGENPVLPVLGGAGLAAAALVYGGTRARVAAPGNRIAAAAGAAGVFYLLVAVLYPFDPPAIGFMRPIQLFMEEDGVWAHQVIGFFRLLAVMVLGIAAVIAAMNLPARPGARARARLALCAWWGHLALLLAAPGVVLVYAIVQDGLDGIDLAVAAANIARQAVLTTGLLFLLYVSATDFLLRADEPE